MDNGKTNGGCVQRLCHSKAAAAVAAVLGLILLIIGSVFIADNTNSTHPNGTHVDTGSSFDDE